MKLSTFLKRSVKGQEALEMFYSRGWNNGRTIHDVAVLTGVSDSTVYRYKRQFEQAKKEKDTT